MKSRSHRWLLGAALAALGSTSLAHTGHGTDSLMTGFVHPLGADHLFAALAVGLWSAAALARRVRWTAAATFLGGVLAGALGAALVAPPAPPDIALAASVAVLGALLIAPHALPPGAALVVLACAAVLHGAAHGAEGAASAGFDAYVAGLLLATAGLLAAGCAVGAALRRLHEWAWRAVAVAFSAAGLLLMSMA